MRRTRLSAIALATALLAPSLGSAAVVPGAVLSKDGDVPVGTITFGAVTNVNPPFANPDGTVGYTVRLDTQEECVMLDGLVAHCDDPAIWDDGETSGSCNAAGQWVYNPEDAPTSDESILGYAGLIATEGGVPVGFVAPDRYNFLYRPQVTSNGTVVFLASIALGGGSSTNWRAIYTVPGGNPANASILVQSGDTFGTAVVGPSFSDLDNDYNVSDNTQHYIIIANDDLAAGTTDDTFVGVDGTLIAREGSPTGGGDNWDNFDGVSINDLGDFVFSGDTDGATSGDEFVAWNGNIIAREGDTLGGVTLGTTASVNLVGINDGNNVAHGWSYSGNESVFITCAPSDAANTTRVIATEGDEIDEDGDGVGDYLITEFASQSSSGGSYLANNGFLFTEATVTEIGGATGLEALVRLNAQCCPDRDADGQCDVDDPCPDDRPDDSDGDGVCESVDQCIGDDAVGDRDGDGTCDDVDICPDDFTDDTDGDGFCDGVDLCDGNDLRGDADGDGVCNDLDFGLLISRVAPGDPMTFLAFNAPPGADVNFAVTAQGLGNLPCFGSTCGRLGRPTVLATVQADASGLARFDITVPRFLNVGTYLHFQAIYDSPIAGDTTEVVIRRARNPLP